jgi:RNA polymerase primary sigma factor
VTVTTRTTEPSELAPYLEIVRRYPPLSRDEEHDLAMRARAGDPTARERLIRHNLRLVITVSRLQRRGTVRLDDVVQEGNLGLLRAVEKFDPHAGTRFSTYAVWWIRAYVGKYLKQARSNVRPKSGTVALHDVSLDARVHGDGDVSHLDRLETEGPGPEDTYAQGEGDHRTREALSRVRKRVGNVGWDIVHARLAHDDPATLEEIGRRWGLSRERVRQIEVETKNVLRRHLGPPGATADPLQQPRRGHRPPRRRTAAQAMRRRRAKATASRRESRRSRRACTPPRAPRAPRSSRADGASASAQR